MARYGYNYLQPLTEKQLRKRVRRQINPYLASGSRAISGYSESLARALSSAAPQTQANYLRAEQQQASVDQALANRLSGAGSAAQSDLAAQLGQAGLPTGAAQAVGQVGTGAANAGYASGSASLSALLAQGAAAQQYAGQLPNIARLGGLQQQGQYRQQLLSQLPKLMQQAEAENFQKAVAVQSGLVQGTKLQQSQSQFQQRQQLSQQKFQTQTQLALARLNLSKGQLALAQKHERAYEAGRKGKGGFTPAQIGKLKSDAIDSAIDWKHGRQNPDYDPTSDQWHKGTPDKQQWIYKPRRGDARGALRLLILHGIPPSLADWAVGQVYGKWKGRGRGGTGPW